MKSKEKVYIPSREDGRAMQWGVDLRAFGAYVDLRVLTYAPLARRSIPLVQKSISRVFINVKIVKGV